MNNVSISIILAVFLSSCGYEELQQHEAFQKQRAELIALSDDNLFSYNIHEALKQADEIDAMDTIWTVDAIYESHNGPKSATQHYRLVSGSDTIDLAVPMGSNALGKYQILYDELLVGSRLWLEFRGNSEALFTSECLIPRLEHGSPRQIQM